MSLSTTWLQSAILSLLILSSPSEGSEKIQRTTRALDILRNSIDQIAKSPTAHPNYLKGFVDGLIRRSQKGDIIDSWKNAINISVEHGDWVDRVEIRSSGPDGVYFTDDDISTFLFIRSIRDRNESAQPMVREFSPRGQSVVARIFGGSLGV